MRNRIIVIFILLWSFLLAASVAKKQLFKKPPPGTIRVSDSLYIDKTPIRVIDYLEFLSAIRNSYSPQMHDSIKRLPNYGLTTKDIRDLQSNIPWDSIYYLKMLTRTWTTYANDIKKYDVDYHIKNPKYYNYPIININYDQVKEFCKWRSDMVKIHYATTNYTEKQRRAYPMNFEYRVPTKKEWDRVMGKFFEHIGKIDQLTKASSHDISNLGVPYGESKGFQYNSDNIGEMLDNYIITVGFAWDEKMELGNINYVKFDGPNDWVGFRCVCEILPEKGRKRVVKKDVERDKFGKIIKPTKSNKKSKSQTTTVEKTPKAKSKKTKSKKVKTESVNKKRRKL